MSPGCQIPGQKRDKVSCFLSPWGSCRSRAEELRSTLVFFYFFSQLLGGIVYIEYGLLRPKPAPPERLGLW